MTPRRHLTAVKTRGYSESLTQISAIQAALEAPLSPRARSFRTC
jgi:hypothetical protein